MSTTKKIETPEKEEVHSDFSQIKKEIKLRKDYYNCLKPYCSNCQKAGKNSEDYVFCSTNKEPVKIYETDRWGYATNKVIHIFTDIYKCNVYHWTIYQGQNKLNKNE